ncbi:Gag-Pol polyprotein, partial [Trachymyrmex zeteki]
YVGAAVFSPQLHAELMFRLSSYTSVFSAEAYAIYTAITISIDLHLRKVTIVTDSKSVLETISSYNNRTNNYLIPLIKAVLEEAEANGTRIQFVWVPSHKGIAGNEKADNLAKRAIRQGIEPNFKVPYSDICAVIKQRISDNFYRHLESMAQTKGTYFFTHILRRSPKPWYYRKKISRKIIVMLNRLRSNHYNLNVSLYRKNLTEVPSCPCGSPRQDIIHLIYECPYTYVQARYLRRFIDRTSNTGSNLAKFSRAISDPSECVCRLIFNLSITCDRHF